MNKRHFLFPLAVLLLTAAPSMSQRIGFPDHGLYGHYPLGDNAHDISGLNHHGTLVGLHGTHPDRGDRPCATATYYQNGYVSLPHNGLGFGGDSATSLSFWVYFNKCAQGSIRLRSDTLQPLFALNCYPGIAGGWIPSMNLVAAHPTGDGPSRLAPSSFLYAYDQWYHMVVVARNNRFDWYVNAELRYSGTSKKAIEGVNELLFMADSGVFDDVRIYSLGLTPGQVAHLYQMNAVCNTVTSLELGAMAEGPKVVPNPSVTGSFEVVSAMEIEEVVVRDMAGSEVHRTPSAFVQGLAPGAYTVQTRQGNLIRTSKLIVAY